ncbi:uncharacterized protein CANTADRAFT_21875 [Suhomyces tanzawaensis NRRL Y-17324]|uniref:SRP9 domain-containing protein n=1 Tax=Suhomyces tanzawaensis NRRL Y-17324 TaxID=984487 RepID=A0A1E4SHW3_9ASCO|nr:uncharacterized protein CANTADRAFT_21875 [Suhomyces tanzawaensis NRRL Y-17324]ODV79108.1 hypothetical protein CANTADRAFT_21875 [Suhomyces tanzawaensis NRRL Y-17324]
MPRVKSLDTFIESASALLAAYPSSTTLSVTYTNVHKKQQQGKVSKDSKSNKATHSVSTKLFEPSSGKCIKYTTYKIKELSRILTFIGPKGVNVITQTKTNEGEEETVHKVGLASIMSNTKFEDVPEEEPVKEEVKEKAPVVEPSASKKKSKKKKGKK